MQVQVTATLEKAPTLKDGSLRLTFETQELDTDNCVSLFQMRLQFGWLLFSPNKEEQAPLDEPTPQDENKTPSQRLRACIYRYWQAHGESKIDFDSFYRSQIETYISRIKSLLDAGHGNETK